MAQSNVLERPATKATPPAYSAVARSAAQHRWLNAACGTEVTIRLTDGNAFCGVLQAHDDFTLVVDCGADTLPELVFKHAVACIRMSATAFSGAV